MNASPDMKRSAATALAAFVFLGALAALSILLVQPPRAVPESAPPDVFSSARAMRHVRAIALKAHPTGSEEIERVRRYIIGELGALGVNVEVQTAEVVPAQGPEGFPVAAARVQNIVARVPGTANSRALMLAAHYDSVPTGPGASDDGAGVATLLETLRAIKSGPPLKNDLVVVFSDAEELGLIGAHAFADENPLMKDVGLVLNFEARGASGPSFMFETSEGNGALIREFAQAAPHPVADSLMYAVYKRLPNDTDMTVYKRAGAAGLNFAYADRITSYHTALDSTDVLDERSLQHHGSYALSLARRFGGLDLSNLKSRDAVYFNFIGPVFIHYSEARVIPLTVSTCIIFVAVILIGVRKGRLTLAGVTAGVLNFLVAAALSGLLVTGVWRIARALHAGYDVLPWRTPYEKWPYEIGFALLAFAAFAAVNAILFRRASAANLFAGALACWLVLLVLVTAVLPLGSFLFAWPLLFALVGFAFVLAPGEGGFESSKGLAVIALCAAPGVCIFAPLVWMFFMMLGLDLGGFFMLLVVLLAALVAPHFRVLTARRRWLLPAAAALAGVVFVVVGLSLAGFDARHRKVDSVFYFLDADTRRASWSSTDAALDEWTSQFVKPGAQKMSLAEIFPWSKQTSFESDAPAVSVQPPDAQVVEDKTDGDARTVRLRLSSPRRAAALIFYTNAGLRRAELDGKTLLEGAPGGERNGLRVSFSAPPPEGLELRLVTRAGAPLRLVVEDLSYGLPEIAGESFRARPDDEMPVPAPRTSDTTVVRKTFDLGGGAR
jgi:hypothetical protein